MACWTAAAPPRTGSRSAIGATDPISLDGWYLTDDAARPTQWRFPDVTIDGGGYLLVFASGKYPNGPPGELHTSFKLSGNGEYSGPHPARRRHRRVRL